MALTWTDQKQLELQNSVPFNVENCKITITMPLLENDRRLYFSRVFNHKDERGKEQMFEYFDFGLITLAQKEFQHLQCSMNFGNTFYSLFSGQSKKVCNYCKNLHKEK